jgi:hypothetical protein
MGIGRRGLAGERGSIMGANRVTRGRALFGGVQADTLSTKQSATAPTIGNGATITTASIGGVGDTRAGPWKTE